MKNKMLALLLMSSLTMTSCGNNISKNQEKIVNEDNIDNENDSNYLTFESILNQYSNYTYFDEVLEKNNSKDELYKLDDNINKYMNSEDYNNYCISNNGYNVVHQLAYDLIESSIYKKENMENEFNESNEKFDYKYFVEMSMTKHKYYIPSFLQNKYFVLLEKITLLKEENYSLKEYNKELHEILKLAKEILLTGEGIRNHDDVIISSGVSLDLDNCKDDEYNEITSRLLVK